MMPQILKNYLKFLLNTIKQVSYPLFEYRFEKQLKDVNSENILPIQFFRDLPDDYFFWLLVHSHSLGHKTNGLIPELPPPHMQRDWTGSTGDATFKEAFSFYSRILQWIGKYSTQPIEQTKILDFGCGWGRIIRFFLREIPHTQLYGSDCWEKAIDVCRETNIWCEFSLNDPFPPTDYADNSMDLIYLYSVFSHLSEKAHLAWLAEFQRILRPGGLLIVTTRSRKHLLTLSQKRKNVSHGLFHSVLPVEAFPDINATLKDYDNGKFCYSGTGGGGPLNADFYGEACIPEKYARERWQGFEFLTGSQPDRFVNQNVFCLRKR